jgi:hypothetical protein
MAKFFPSWKLDQNHSMDSELFTYDTSTGLASERDEHEKDTLNAVER